MSRFAMSRILLAALFVLTLVAPPQFQAAQQVQESAPLDLATLKLQVAKVEIITSISNPGFGHRVGAKAGFRLLSVTLTGTTSQRFQMTIQGDVFSAVYETPRESFNDRGVRSVEIVTEAVPSVGVLIGNGSFWSVERGQMSAPVGPGPVNIKVAFTLPEEVSTFYVRYPALADGKATVARSAP